jgi:rhodanese-related sulfurtransferase
MKTSRTLLLAAALCAAPLARAQEVKTISTAELKAKAGPAPSAWDFTLVDSRTETEFNEGHIPGAVLVPAKQTAEKLPAVAKDKAKLVIFYCNGPGCTKSLKGAKAAAAAGYSNIREYNEGLPAWRAAGLKVDGTPLPDVPLPLVAPAALQAQLASKPFLLDIRDADEFAKFHVDGSVNVPLDSIAKRISEIPAGKVYLLDHIGHQAPIAARLLAKLGRRDLAKLDGGVMAWSDAGLPTVASK